MSDHSAIEWTDATWNPTTGCTKVSPGCAHCYIERTPAFRIAGRTFRHGHINLRLHADRLEQPLHWRKPRRVFVNSLSDLFHEDVPDDFIDRVMLTIVRSYQHIFQVLTKRPERMHRYFSDDALRDRIDRLGLINNPGTGRHGKIPATIVRQWPMPTLWLGVSVENEHWTSRIHELLQTPAAVRFISAEPLLGPVNLEPFLQYAPFHEHYKMTLGTSEWRGLDWVIVGGESGPGARPFDVAWARSIIRQCQRAGVPVFVKQLGARAYGPDVHSVILRDRKGGDMTEWPEDLRVREYPEARA